MNNNTEKRICRYGEDCYRFIENILERFILSLINRIDPEHRQKFLHPNNKIFQRSNSNNFGNSGKEKCKYGNICNK